MFLLPFWGVSCSESAQLPTAIDGAIRALSRACLKSHWPKPGRDPALSSQTKSKAEARPRGPENKDLTPATIPYSHA